MYSKALILEETFQSRFCIDKYLLFAREFFLNLKVVSPDRENEDISYEYRDTIESYRNVALYQDPEGKLVDILAVKLRKTSGALRLRSKQRSFISFLLSANHHDAAIVAFYNEEEEQWRLSFIRLDYEFAAGLVKMELLPAKRYSYLVGEGEPCHTVAKQLLPIFDEEKWNPTLDRIEEAFSVENVTRDFFEKYKEKYLELKEYLDADQDFIREAVERKFTSEQFAKKLIGQVAFLYFLQKKGWLGVHDWQNWGEGSKSFVRDLFQACSKSKNMNYYNDYLEPMFYEALNHKRGADHYYKRFNCKIPFLNGGLFEPLKSYDWEYINFHIPDSIFSNTEEKGREADGILDIFDRYNFTMHEDEPLEREVAVDPEMLGKIFENLLDINDRKSKGTFYTPREVVHYMCQESIIHYLVKEASVPYEDIKQFVLFGEFMKDEDCSLKTIQGEKSRVIPETIYQKLRQIDKALENIRVADPAVGSGAFPLGMLSEIVKIRDNITYYYASILERSEDKKRVYEERNLYSLKWNTIKNCIYAVDIEASAVDITKLRLWLSLVIDTNLEPTMVDQLFGQTKQKQPRVLPNLDYNIMCGNSLIDEYGGMHFFDKRFLDPENQDYDGIWMELFAEDRNNDTNELFQQQVVLFEEENPERKKEIKNDIDRIITDIVKSKLQNDNNPAVAEKFEILRKEASKPFFIWELEFGRVFQEKKGFDIVIGNPPYIKERDNKNVFDCVNNTDFGRKYHQGKMDYWYYFLHKAVSLINREGTIIYITPRYWLNSAGASLLIERIKNELSFVQVVDIGKLKVFDNVVGYHMIAQYQLKNTSTTEFIYKKLENCLNDLTKDYSTPNITVKELNNHTVITANNEISFEESASFDNAVLLGDICNISQGVVEASDRVSKKMFNTKPREDVFVGKGIFVLDKEEIEQLGLTEIEKSVLVKYLDGDSISRYHISFDEKYLIYSDKALREKIAQSSDMANIKNHLDNMAEYITSSNKPYGLHRPRSSEYFVSPKIIVPSMFKDNNFAMDTEGEYYVGMSFSVIIQANSSYPLEYILAILNSDIAREWFYINGKHRGSGVDIGVDKLRTFPIIKAEEGLMNSIVSFVRQLMDYRRNEENELAAELDRKINGFVKRIYMGK